MLQERRHCRSQVCLDLLPRDRLQKFERGVVVRFDEVIDRYAVTFRESESRPAGEVEITPGKRPGEVSVNLTHPRGGGPPIELHPRHSSCRQRAKSTNSRTSSSGTEQAKPQNATSRGART